MGKEAFEYGYKKLFQDARGDLLTTALKKAIGTSGIRDLAENKRLLEERKAVQKAAEEKLAAEMALVKQAEVESHAAEEVRRKAMQERRIAETRAVEAAEKQRIADENVEAERKRVAELTMRLEQEESRSRAESIRITGEYERRIAAERTREIADKARLAAEMTAREKSAADKLIAEKLEIEQRAAEVLNRLKETERQHNAALEEASRVANTARISAEKAIQEKLKLEQQMALLQEEKSTRASVVSPRITSRVGKGNSQSGSADKIKNSGKLIVYDITAGEELRTVALILSEAIREELYNRGDYEIVNRENIKQIMEELKFQQSGMVNDSEAIKIGKSMAAREIILGQLSPIGKTLVLQSKRIDMSTMGNISFASIRCESRKEETMLDKLSELVDGLFKNKESY